MASLQLHVADYLKWVKLLSGVSPSRKKSVLSSDWALFTMGLLAVLFSSLVSAILLGLNYK